MITRATAIPLAIYPWSNTSHIVHWLTRNHGKISTLLKGALRPKSPFLGEYELFSTSELLYFTKHARSLHTGKECALLHRRKTFRNDWRAMQTASYLTALIHRSTPEESPQPDLFEFYEDLLDLTEEHGQHVPFLFWAELHFCDFHGHAPNLTHCVNCLTEKKLHFCASAGGLACSKCAREKKLPTLPCPPDVLAMLRNWQHADHPEAAIKTRLSTKQLNALNIITETFMIYHFNILPDFRRAVFTQTSQESSTYEY